MSLIEWDLEGVENQLDGQLVQPSWPLCLDSDSLGSGIMHNLA